MGGGFESSTFKHLFDIASRFWSLGPAASQVVFDGGLYRAQLHQYEATYNADLANYRQTVLVAFQRASSSVEALGGGWDHTQLHPTPSQLAEKVPASTYADAEVGCEPALPLRHSRRSEGRRPEGSPRTGRFCHNGPCPRRR